MFQLKQKPLRVNAPLWKLKSSPHMTTYKQTRKTEVRKPERLPIKSMKGFLYRKKGESFKKVDLKVEARLKEIDFDRESLISVQPAPSMDMPSQSEYRETFRSGDKGSIVSVSRFGKTIKAGQQVNWEQIFDDNYSRTEYYRDLNQRRSQSNFNKTSDRRSRFPRFDSRSKQGTQGKRKNDTMYISNDLKLLRKGNPVIKKKKRLVFRGERDKRLKLGLSFLPFVKKKNTIYSKQLEIKNGNHEEFKKSTSEIHEEVSESKTETIMATLSEFVKLKHEKMTKTDKLNDDYAYLKNATCFKIEDLHYEDEEFNRTTKPTDAFNQAIFHFDKNKTDKNYIKNNLTEAEFVLTQDAEVILNSDLTGKARVYTDILKQALEEEEFLEDDVKIKKGAETMFSIVQTFIKNPHQKEKNFLPGFFDACHKISKVYKDREQREEDTEVIQKIVSDTSLAMNTLVNSLKDSFNFIGEMDKMNMVKGYIQHLFFIFYDLTSLSYSQWRERLQLMKYTMLTIPRNINIFFSCQKLMKTLFEDPDFVIIFKRFYTSIVTLILKSEFMSSTDVYIWKFVLDCFALHFSFIRLTRSFNFCQEIWNLNENINSENIFLRFITTINIFPYQLVLNSKIKDSLSYNLVMLAKHFENLKLYTTGRITFIHRAIIRKIFTSSFELLDSRYKHEEEQVSILRIIYCFMEILKFYINYNTEYGSVEVVKQGVLPFKSSFKEILYKLHAKKTIKKCQDVNEDILESILMCNEGLDRMREVTRVKRKIASILEKRFKKSSAIMDIIAEEDQKLQRGLMVGIPEIKEV